MVTGASTADVAIVLVDARNGVVEQTHRHAFLASLLRVPHIVLAVNKMDLVGFAQERLRRDRRRLPRLRRLALGRADVLADPDRRAAGRQRRRPLERTCPGTTGPALLELPRGRRRRRATDDRDRRALPGAVRHPADVDRAARLPRLRRPGRLRRAAPGDAVVVLPSGRTRRSLPSSRFDGPLEAAFAPLSVTVRLADDLDVSRGDMIVAADEPADRDTGDHADVCWMVDAAAAPRRALPGQAHDPHRQGDRLDHRARRRT